MKTNVTITGILIFSAFLFGGCMMGAKMGMMAHERSRSPHEDSAGTTKEIVKEASYNGFHLTATFPALEVHTSAMLRLTIDSSGNPARGMGKVRVVKMREEENDEIVLDGLINLANNGTWEYTFAPHENASFHIELSISSLGSESLESPIILSAMVTPQHQGHDAGSDPASDSTMTISGIIMGTIMVAMMAWRFL